LIHFSNVTKQYGPRVLYKKASFQINAGEKVGLVGPNGAGKTTVFRVLVGEEGYDSGSISKSDKIRVGYFSQDIGEMKGRSALEEVKSAVGDLDKIQSELRDIEKKLENSATEPVDDDVMTGWLERYGELQSLFDDIGGYSVESRAAEILTGLGIGPEDYHRPTESFSGGWKMRIALSKILLINPDLLLMDEPTNHLDMESIVWLEEWLRQFPGSLLMTSHDREFMNRLVSKVVEVANQAITSFTGNYDFYEKEKAIRKDQLVAAARRQEEMLAKEEEFIARFAARASHAAQVQSRVKKLDKIERIEVPAEESLIQMEWPVPVRGGDEVVKLSNLKKTWNREKQDPKLVFSNVNALVKRLDRVAVVGVNGAGKSTLLKIIAGHTEASEGKAQLGASIQIGYFSQNSMDVLDPELTIIDEMQSHFPQAGLGYLRSLLGAFKFSGDDVLKKVRILSGGEKSRVVLATILGSPVNFLILDEPTNHLDIGSRQVLLDAIKQFPGTVMIVSHDRHFLKEITTRVFEVHHNKIQTYDETYTEYLDRKKREAAR